MVDAAHYQAHLEQCWEQVGAPGLRSLCAQFEARLVELHGQAFLDANAHHIVAVLQPLVNEYVRLFRQQHAVLYQQQVSREQRPQIQRFSRKTINKFQRTYSDRADWFAGEVLGIDLMNPNPSFNPMRDFAQASQQIMERDAAVAQGLDPRLRSWWELQSRQHHQRNLLNLQATMNSPVQY
ncbi:MAG: hypothetical protein HOV79_27950 [Hamadaea sp.]|nr:hypothetical protein [Hamadaea sp.]